MKRSPRDAIFEFAVVGLLILTLSLLLLSIVRPARAQDRPIIVPVCGQLVDFEGNPPAQIVYLCPRVRLPHVAK